MNDVLVKWKTSNPCAWLIGLKYFSLEQQASLAKDPPSVLSTTQQESWVHIFMSNLMELEITDEIDKLCDKFKADNIDFWLIGLKYLVPEKRILLANEPPSNLSKTQLVEWVDILMSTYGELNQNEEMKKCIGKWKDQNVDAWLCGLKHIQIDQRE